MPVKTLTIRANAKINLALALKKRRMDGYHDVDLIYQEIDYCDNVTLKQSDSISFSTDSPQLQNEADNLCEKAARLLQRDFGIPGMEIILEKRIPIGAGLGGGSSDAAAVLKGGVEIYNLQVTEKQLLALASELGADVPFFLIGGTAYGRGIGNVLKRIRIDSNYYILLVLPKIRISTVWAYKNLNLGLTRIYSDDKFRGFRFHNLELNDFRSEFFNDFEKLIFKQYSQLESIKFSLYEEGAVYAALSGSGSTVFGLFSATDALKKAAHIVGKRYSVHTTQPVKKIAD